MPTHEHKSAHIPAFQPDRQERFINLKRQKGSLAPEEEAELEILTGQLRLLSQTDQTETDSFRVGVSAEMLHRETHKGRVI